MSWAVHLNVHPIAYSIVHQLVQLTLHLIINQSWASLLARVVGGWWSDIYEIRANLNSVVVEVEVWVELGKTKYEIMGKKVENIYFTSVETNSEKSILLLLVPVSVKCELVAKIE